MTDHQKLLLTLLSEADDADPVDGRPTPLELMAVLYDLGEEHRRPLGTTTRAVV